MLRGDLPWKIDAPSWISIAATTGSPRIGGSVSRSRGTTSWNRVFGRILLSGCYRLEFFVTWGSRLTIERSKDTAVDGGASQQGGQFSCRQGVSFWCRLTRRIRWGAGRGPAGRESDPEGRSVADRFRRRTAPARTLPSGERAVSGRGAGRRRFVGGVVDSRAGDRDGSPQGPGLACEARYAVRQPGPQGSHLTQSDESPVLTAPAARGQARQPRRSHATTFCMLMHKWPGGIADIGMPTSPTGLGRPRGARP